MKIKSIITAALTLAFTALASAQHLVYEGTSGPGKGKHIVFLANDHEYRSEETCPALARVLAKHHGFKCTVLFGIDKNGNIQGGANNLPGMEALKTADLCFVFTRWIAPTDEQMQHLDDYIKRGGPVMGLRTASHAFKFPKGSKFYEFYDSSRTTDEDGSKMYRHGFGHNVLGNTWVGHYGSNAKGTRIKLRKDQTKHPVLIGVANNAFTSAGAYVGIPREDFVVLADAQCLDKKEANSTREFGKPLMPCVWVRHYLTDDGKKHRVFQSTQGASRDIVDENFRRLVINGAFWCMGMEDKIKADMKVDLVGPYQPSKLSMGGYVKKMKPSDLAGWDTPIPAAKK